MSLNIDMKMIRTWNCSGSLILFMNSWTLATCNVVNPGKIYHSNSIGSPSIVSKVCIVLNLWTNSTVVPTQYLMLDSPFQDITQNLRKQKPKATLVSVFAKRFPAGRWSFLGLAAETELYTTYNERPRGEWDRVAEMMMIKQTVACKVNMEWRSELSLWTTTILTHGSEVHTAWINWSRISTTRTKTTTTSWEAVRRICVKIESKITKTYFCQLIHKSYIYWGENLDWCWTRRIFALRLSSVEETDQSSSSW